MESSLRNTRMGAVGNDEGREGRKKGLSSILWLEETIGPSPMSTTCQEPTLPSASLSSMTGRQAHIPREKKSPSTKQHKKGLRNLRKEFLSGYPNLNKARNREGLKKRKTSGRNASPSCSCLKMPHHCPYPGVSSASPGYRKSRLSLHHS